MYLRKITMVGMIAVLASSLFVMPVSAHGHHGSRSGSGTESNHLCAVCTEEGCTQKGWHVHDGSTYCGYDHEGGFCDGTCNTARVCTVDQCTETGHHIHDGIGYCGYDHESGFCDGTCGSVTVCTVEGCTKTGCHTHNGVTYCGYDHEGGYCDKTCEQQRSTNTSRRHHGGHHGRNV